MQECEGFIKDADCTKDTPLMYGELDIPIYGTGKRICLLYTSDAADEL